MIAAEDLLIHKLLAGRPRDDEDAVGILGESRAEIDVARVSALMEQLAAALADDELRRRVRRILKTP